MRITGAALAAAAKAMKGELMGGIEAGAGVDGETGTVAGLSSVSPASGVAISPMVIDDFDEVHALWLSCPGMGLNDVDDSRDGIARLLARNPQTCLVARMPEAGAVRASGGGRPANGVGAIAGVILAGTDGRRAYIYHTAVRPDLQGRGIGRALVDAELAALRDLGISKVALVAFKRNAAGNAFWERMGFTLREDIAYRNRALRDLVRIDT